MRFCLKHGAAAVAASAMFSTAPASATGIPVLDIANLIQTIQQVLDDVTQIQNQAQQITQLQQQLNSINGARNLGQVFDSPTLRNYVPAQAYTAINAVATGGYSSLTPTAKTLRDAEMVYNCMDLTGAARTDCQAGLAAPYQTRGLLQDAMKFAAGRLSQITALMGQINATVDQKAVQEIQARIGAENALLAHEVSQIQMLQGMADSDERIARSRDRERQYQMLGRTGKVAHYLP
jgi:type IV secretion system protein VirB5